jgi:hypothetical protein
MICAELNCIKDTHYSKTHACLVVASPNADVLIDECWSPSFYFIENFNVFASFHAVKFH